MIEVQAESSQRLGEDEEAQCIAISAALLIFESAREMDKQAAERKRG